MKSLKEGLEKKEDSSKLRLKALQYLDIRWKNIQQNSKCSNMVWYLGNQDCFTESDLLCDDI